MKQFIALSGRGTRNNEFVTTARVGKDVVANILREQHGFRSYSFALPLKQVSQILFGLTDEQVWNDKYKEVAIDGWGLTPRRIFQLLGTEGGRLVFREDLWGQLGLNIWEDVKNGTSRDVIGVAEKTDFLPPPQTEESIDALIERAAKLLFQVSDSEAAFSLAHESPVGMWDFTYSEIIDKLKNETIPAVLGLPKEEAWKKYCETRPLFPNIGLVSNGPYGLPPSNPNGLSIPDCRFDNEADIVRAAGGVVSHVCREIPEDIKVVAGHASEMGVTPKEGDIFIINDGTIEELGIKVSNALNELELRNSGQEFGL